MNSWTIAFKNVARPFYNKVRCLTFFFSCQVMIMNFFSSLLLLTTHVIGSLCPITFFVVISVAVTKGNQKPLLGCCTTLSKELLEFAMVPKWMLRVEKWILGSNLDYRERLKTC